ncbi:uncharacterized protein LOC134768413 [Penaeus indicus]|uniref:uncharacterized protein LOC134768413 n=1 Tax=Penaeus indicus TaxID=29960 RepID=UPI00300C92F2
MTGRGRALTELMRRRKVDIMCVQETRWSGNKLKELGDGHKLIYGSANLDKRYGVGIIVSGKFKSAVVETGYIDDENDEFWTTLQDEFEKVAEDERCVIGVDLNEHVGRGSDVISRVHGGMCYAEFVIHAGKEILGETSGKIWKDKETWWFTDEVQRAITEKKEAKKKWEISPAERDKEEYKTKN